MYRTIISLNEKDRDWLKHSAEAQQTSMSELIRRAITFYRQQEEHKKLLEMNQALDEASKCWNGEDGLDWQNKLRNEWNER